MISPDGKSLAFVSQRNGDTAAQLYVLPLAGGEPARITNVPTGVAQPMWFPDGKRIAFLSRVWPDLDTMEKQGARQKERADNKSTAQAWDGGPIYFWDTWLDDRQLHVFSVGAEGGEPVNLTAGTGLELPRSAVQLESPLYDISPEGTELAFVADSDPATNVTNLDVYTVAVGGKDAANRSQGNVAGDGVPLYSPDGRWLAFAQQRIKGFYGDLRRLMLLDRRGGSVREVTGEAWDRSADGLVWAPDSKRLYGTIDDAGSVRVYEIPLEGKPRVDHRRRDVLLARNQRPARRAGGPAADFPRAADRRAHRPEVEEGRQAEPDQRCAARGHGARQLRERHVRGRERQADPDVGELPAGFRQVEEVSAVRADPRRPAQRDHQCHAVPLERTGVRQLGLRHGLAEFPRLVGLRQCVHRLDQPLLG